MSTANDRPRPALRPAWPAVGDRYENIVTFTADEISQFATSLGDTNPLHHDAAFAESSRFRGLIACGPHTSAVFIALIARWLSFDWDMVGLDFSIRFDQAIRAETPVRMSWTLTEIEPNSHDTRACAVVEGEARDPSGRLLLSGRARVVLWPKET